MCCEMSCGRLRAGVGAGERVELALNAGHSVPVGGGLAGYNLRR